MTKTKTTTFSEVSTEALVQQFLVYITHSESLCQDPMTDVRHQMKTVQAIEVIRCGPSVQVSTISLPVDASGEIRIGSSSDQGPAVSIGLPVTSDHENARVAGDGTVVYQDSTGN